MKKNRITLIITLVLLVIAVLLIYTTSDSTLRKDISDFAVEDTAKITKIYMADKAGNEVLLEKTGPSYWQLNHAHKASLPKVKALLKTLQDIQVMQPVPRSGHNTVVKRLAANSTKVEIYTMEALINVFGLKLFPREKNSTTYFVGGSTKENIGTYMLMENSTQPYITYLPNFRGFISPRYSVKEDEWRDHQVFRHRLEDISSIVMQNFPEPQNSYRVNNIDNLTWSLIDTYRNDTVHNYDTLKLLSFVTSFEDLRFESLLTNKIDQSLIDSVTGSTPVHQLMVIDKDGDTTAITTYRKEGFKHIYDEITEGPLMEPYDIERMYAEMNDGKDIVLIQNFVFDKVLRPLSYFQKNGN